MRAGLGPENSATGRSSGGGAALRRVAPRRANSGDCPAASVSTRRCSAGGTARFTTAPRTSQHKLMVARA